MSSLTKMLALLTSKAFAAKQHTPKKLAAATPITPMQRASTRSGGLGGGVGHKPKKYTPPKPRTGVNTMTNSRDTQLSKDALLLAQMLTYMRPHETEAEEEFTTKYIDTIPNVRRDTFGNRYVRINKRATTMFTAHLDTVHRKGGRQKVYYDSITDEFFPDPKSNCLGADDTTGVFIMLKLIERGVPGLYCFFRGEEVGRLGSKFMEENIGGKAGCPSVKAIKRCISLDRKGMDDVITHQSPGRGCSAEFAKALSAALNAHKKEQTGARFSPSPNGSFTDSASFFRRIPECTNLSIGYYSQHTTREVQRVGFALELIDRLEKVDWINLPTVRDPTYVEPPAFGHFGGVRGSQYDAQDYWDRYNDDTQDYYPSKPAASGDLRSINIRRRNGTVEGMTLTKGEIEHIVFDHPEEAATMLFDLAASTEYLKKAGLTLEVITSEMQRVKVALRAADAAIRAGKKEK